MDNFLDKTLEILANAGGRIVLAILVFIVGKFIINKLMKVFTKAKFVKDMDATASRFILSAIKVVLYVVLVVSIIASFSARSKSADVDITDQIENNEGAAAQPEFPTAPIQQAAPTEE